MENQELELNRLEQRLNNQDLTLEAIRKELQSLKEKNNNKEITALNQRLDIVINDLKTLHSFLEKTDQELLRQNSALNEVHTTLQTVAQAFDEPAVDSPNIYIVQTGDTLGEIAIKNRTTIKKIKELNEMSKDTIFVGQKLRLTKWWVQLAQLAQTQLECLIPA